MKIIRRLHLYLGCFFAPLLILYTATGWYQTFNPNRNKALGEGESIVARLRSVHVDQIYPAKDVVKYSPMGFRWLVAAMCAAFIVTVLLGVVLAFKGLRDKWLVWLSLGLGLLVPIAVLWLGQRRG